MNKRCIQREEMMARFILICLILFSIAGLRVEAQEPKEKIGPRPLPPGMQRLDNRELGDGLLPGRRPFLALLSNSAIVEELHLTEEQKQVLNEVAQEQQKRYTAWSEDNQKRLLEARSRFDPNEAKKPGLTNSERINLINNSEMMALSRATQETVTRLNNEADAVVARKVLTKRQAIRLREIQAQAEGPAYFERQEVREKLALEEDQIAEIRNISTEHNNEFRASMLIPSKVSKPQPDAEPSPETKAYTITLAETKKKVAQLRVSTMRSIEKVLSNAQRKTYKNMVGEPFVFYEPKDEKARRDEPVSK